MLSMSFFINHPIHDRPIRGLSGTGQLTKTTCWAAAAGMILGYTPWTRGLQEDGGVNGLTIRSFYTFAQIYGFEVDESRDWPIEKLYEKMSVGPLLIINDCGSYAHAFVLKGMAGDGTPGGTLLAFADPYTEDGKGMHVPRLVSQERRTYKWIQENAGIDKFFWFVLCRKREVG